MGRQKRMKQEYRLFGLWRLMAAFLVMAYHFAHHAANADAVVAWFEHMAPLLDMFFIMSGFLIFEHYGDMQLTRESYLLFLARRLSRLYPLHFVTLSVFVLAGAAAHLGVFQSGMTDTRYAWSALPADLLLLQAWGVQDALSFNYVSWSVSAEWFAYLMFPIVVYAFVRWRLSGLAILLAAILIGLEIGDAGAVTKAEHWYDYRLLGAYRVAADFVFGALICGIVGSHGIALRSQWPAWAVMSVAIVCMFSGAHTYYSLALVGVAIYLAACAERENPDGTRWIKPLLPVTAVSFGIYLWHPVLELVFYSFLWKRVLGLDDVILFWPFMVLPMAATVVVALISANYLEKPMGKRMSAVLKRMINRNISTAGVTRTG